MLSVSVLSEMILGHPDICKILVSYVLVNHVVFSK